MYLNIFEEFTILSKKSYFDDILSSKKVVGSKRGSLGHKNFKIPKSEFHTSSRSKTNFLHDPKLLGLFT